MTLNVKILAFPWPIRNNFSRIDFLNFQDKISDSQTAFRIEKTRPQIRDAVSDFGKRLPQNAEADSSLKKTFRRFRREFFVIELTSANRGGVLPYNRHFKKGDIIFYRFYQWKFGYIEKSNYLCGAKTKLVSMLEDIKQEYDSLAEDYRSFISDSFSREDFVEYNEVLFSAHSCGIEGNSFSVEETRTLKEQGLGMIPTNKPLVEAMEMLDHFKAYEYMVQTANEPLTEGYLKHLHYLLTEHTIAYRHPGATPGEYTDTDMCAGETIFGDHEQLIARVPELLASTEKAIRSENFHPIEVAAIFHGHYEHLHPFRDGNGRLGRLVSNKILLQCNLPLLIIRREDREEYIDCLKLFRRESSLPLINFFFRTCIERMKREIEEKKNATENFRMGWEIRNDFIPTRRQ